MYVCVCSYVCMYVCTCVYVYMYVCVYVRVFMYICMYVCMYSCVCIYVCMCVHKVRTCLAPRITNCVLTEVVVCETCQTRDGNNLC